MEVLDGAMDIDLNAKRAMILNECDGIQQNLYGLDKKIYPLQKEVAATEEANQLLAREIAERREELHQLQNRLTQALF